jgi:acyl-CoA thioester hydrolase
MNRKTFSNYAIEVRFADIDAMGHVNNANYLSYFEQARMRWFSELIGDEWDWEAHGIVLARNEVDYLEPILLSDQVSIEVACARVGNTSLTLTYKVFRTPKHDTTPRLCSKGMSVLVCFDYQTGLKRAVPETWREKIEATQ